MPLADSSRATECLAEPIAVCQAHEEGNRRRVPGDVADNLSEPVRSFREAPQTLVEGAKPHQDLSAVGIVSVPEGIEERVLGAFGTAKDVKAYRRQYEEPRVVRVSFQGNRNGGPHRVLIADRGFRLRQKLSSVNLLPSWTLK